MENFECNNSSNNDLLIIEESEQASPKLDNAVQQYTEEAVKNIQEEMVRNKSTESFQQDSKRIAHMVATAEAFNGSDSNEKFLERIKHEKQEEIKESFKGERLKEQARTLGEKRKKAEEFYNNFRPILEFDFSPLIPKNTKTILFHKKPKKDKKGNIIQENEANIPCEDFTESSKPTYAERSYGIPLMVLMLFLLTIPYCFVTIILAIFNGINAIFNAIARFGKPALIICGSIVGIAIMVLGLYCICLGIDKLFGTTIIAGIIK